MKTLDFNQMENLQGGGDVGCAAGIAMGALTFAAAFFLTGGAAAILWAVTWSLTPSAVALGCTDL
ncbi:MAG: hypothetical protein GKR88_07760 [Flavobacteriaceae bacterium]|nr:MAG: hypothetical protein GKR88_07760 [Flavobacteriaceae bacterium]